MSNDELPGTVDANQSPISVSDAPQSTTAPATEASAEETTGLDLRGYELSERLGGGGMGDVYRAGDPALGRDLAVKVMKAELQGHIAAEQRFLREARVTGSLQHPGIVPIYNLGRLADGRLHYTMRLVRGRTFADILKEEAGQPERLPALLTVFEKICQAVAYAHSKGVLHRDLKPANVMVGRFGEVQVMDWGLAKLLTLGDDPTAPEGAADGVGTRIHTEASETPLAQTRMGREMGTPAYMPPEQALGEWDRVNERADVFALGAILCEILTGEPPYSVRDGTEALRKAKRGDLAEALARLEGCGADAALGALCRECLAAVREHRPRDAEQVAQRIASYQAQVQERLRRAELERIAAEARAREERKKRLWMLATVLLLLAAIAGSTWLIVRARKAEDQARENEALATSAAEAERQAKTLAQTRLTQIEKADNVLMSIFRDLDPHVETKGGPSLRQQLSQHLEHAATQLDEAKLGDAETVARLQVTLGHSLTNLGQAKQAIELLSKARARFEAKLGPEHPDTLATLENLGSAYLSAGRTADALALFEQTLKQREAKLGPDHPDTLRSRSNVAMALQKAGRPVDALRLQEQNLKLFEARLGSNHPDTLTFRSNLASAYLSAGRNADAIRLHEQTLKQKEAKLGIDHPQTLISRNALAIAYDTAGRTTDAIRLHEQTLKQREAKLGIDHPGTLTTRNNLACAYSKAGRTAEAILLFEQTLKQREAKLGTDHPDTLQSRGNLADEYRRVGRNAEAIGLLEPTLKQLEAKLGNDHPDTLATRNSLAAAYRFARRFSDAIRLQEQTLKLCEAKLGTDHPHTLISRGNLATAYQSAGRSDEAIRLLEQTFKQLEAKLGTDHPHTLQVMANLGGAYRDAGRLPEAISLLETVLMRRRNYSGASPAVLAKACANLAEAYEKAGQFDKAESNYRDALELAQRQFGAEDPRTAIALAEVGSYLLRQKKFIDAEALLRRCRAIRDKKQPEAWTTFNTRSALGEALLAQQKYAEAEPLLVQGYEEMKQRHDKIPPPVRQVRLSEALERLVRLCEATGQKDKAADWRRKLDEAKAAQKKTQP